MEPKHWDLNLIICSINGLRIGGYGEQEAISMGADNDLYMMQTTADGGKIYSRTGDRGITLEISVMNTSKSYRDLALLMQTQHGLQGPRSAAPTTILPLPFRLADPVVGDFINSRHTMFMNYALPQKGQTAQAVRFRISLPEPRIDFGILNSL